MSLYDFSLRCMYVSLYLRLFCSLTLCFLALAPLKAQLGYELEIKKPEPYENRVLRAERSGKKKFTKTKRFFQNTYTHYNYFFNANNKVNDVISRAKEAHKDDFSQLLSFYNYSLDETSLSKNELDSVIYKSKTAIVMHDLRNDWIDDMYLLWGAAFYLQKSFDSAYQMFQFINYAFADKEKDGYYRYIGSRMDGNSALSIATKEEERFLKRMIADPPSRNTAFIWQIRTLIEANAMTEANSLILSLKKDPVFPERLHSSLEEVHAYWFFKQNMWDSAASHLVNALDNAKTKGEKARWEYLAGQLYELAKKPELSNEYFSKAIDHTIDPVLDINARLNLIRLQKGSNETTIDDNIAELLKMARRDKYVDYRDVIYFMAAKMEMERNNPAAAEAYLLKGAKYSSTNVASRNRSYIQLANLAFEEKKYLAAAAYYDSIQLAGLTAAEAVVINQRKGALVKVVSGVTRINMQDSLRRIAALPEDERTDYIKKLVRQLRRQQGLKDEEATTGRVGAGGNVNDDVFNPQTKGDWYFYNPVLKKQGVGVFKQEWGNRPNVDNWRRASDVTTQLRSNSPDNTRGNPPVGVPGDPSGVMSFESLLANVPLTEAQVKVSDEVIATSLFSLGTAYLNDLEDYPSSIAAFESIRERFPEFAGMDDVLFQLHYNYTKTGNAQKAAEVKALLLKKYPSSRKATILSTGVDPGNKKPATEVTKVYEGIYDLFIEGRFEDALAAKKNADSLYKTNFWSPQLLYIEAVYHVKEGQDSIAKNTLATIVRQQANTPLAVKAENMIKVLNRRKEIEEELRNLNITRPPEDTMVYVPPFIQQPTAVRRDTTKLQTNTVVINQPPPAAPRRDTMIGKPVVKPTASSSYTYDANAAQYVVVVLNKVDNVFGNEARNAFNRYNKERYYNLPLTSQVIPLDGENRLLLIGNFTNMMQAAEYVQKAIPLSAKEIVPWLKAEKYSFTIISEKNLEVLKTKPDLKNYKGFLEQNSGLKF